MFKWFSGFTLNFSVLTYTEIILAHSLEFNPVFLFSILYTSFPMSFIRQSPPHCFVLSPLSNEEFHVSGCISGLSRLFCLFVFSDPFLHCLNCLGFAAWCSISCYSFFWEFFFFFCNLYFFYVHFITRSSNFTSTSTDISLGVPLYFCINSGKFDIFTVLRPHSHRSSVSFHYFSFFMFLSNIL